MSRSHILVVNDNALTRDVTSLILTRHGDKVTKAKDGREALAAIQELAPDLVLLDIEMPDMDGVEVVTLMDTPVLFLIHSSLADDDPRLQKPEGTRCVGQSDA